MAIGRYSRTDTGRKSTNYCSTVTIVVVVAASLIGAWVMMSSSVDMVESFGVPEKVKKNDKLPKVIENNQKEFEDSSADLPDVPLKRKGGQSENERTNYNVNDSLESNQRKEVEARKDDNKKNGEGDSVSGDEDAGQRYSGEDEGDTSEKKGFEDSNNVDKKKAEEGEGKSEEENSNDVKPGEEPDNKAEESEQNSEQKPEDKENGDEADSQNKKSDQNKETTKSRLEDEPEASKETSSKIVAKNPSGYKWKLCKATAGPDYIPCLDNIQAVKRLRSTSHYEHRERHCPDEPPTCLVPLPKGYRTPVKWPRSRQKIWFANVPHTKLADVKGHQNWVHVSGEYLDFPGGGTQFTHGALSYIDFIEKTLPAIAWGKHTRVILDVGCGVASFGGYLFEKDVLTMSLAPKDEHEAQVQFALERGIPAISAVMGTKRLPFPGNVFDVVHCARCRVPWHVEGGKLLLELNRLLRPGGYFVWSATPVYRKDKENVDIWKAMSKVTKSVCWELVKIGKDKVNDVAAAIYRKPTSNDCYEERGMDDPPICHESDDQNEAWETPLEACMHNVPTDPSERGSQWPAEWPSRVQKPPYWLETSDIGVDGKAAPKDFVDDYKKWKLVIANTYLDGIGVDWPSVRNVMDMRTTYGGFAAALKDMQLWVMNVVSVDSTDTLPIIYERGLFGIYHDWCESFSTYPRSYDLLHADHLFSDLKKRCEFVAVMAEVDRILRPGGWLVVTDDAETISEVENMAKSLHWQSQFTSSKGDEGMVCVQKTRWRPWEEEPIPSAIA